MCGVVESESGGRGGCGWWSGWVKGGLRVGGVSRGGVG